VSEEKPVMVTEPVTITPGTGNMDLTGKQPRREVHAVPKPRQYQHHVLTVIRGLGYEPELLPHSDPGLAGMRKVIEDACAQRDGYTENKFKDAWEALLDSGEIAYNIPTAKP